MLLDQSDSADLMLQQIATLNSTSNLDRKLTESTASAKKILNAYSCFVSCSPFISCSPVVPPKLEPTPLFPCRITRTNFSTALHSETLGCGVKKLRQESSKRSATCTRLPRSAPTWYNLLPFGPILPRYSIPPFPSPILCVAFVLCPWLGSGDKGWLFPPPPQSQP